MRRKALYTLLMLAVFVAAVGSWKAVHARSAAASSSASYQAKWNPQAAANYLDYRETWWQGWPAAQVDHGTVCISCHTVVPYAMMRTTLGRELHEPAMPVPEQVMMANVEKRVSAWSEMIPFYSDAVDGPGKTAESHATEAVLNAVILVSYDRQHGRLRPITRTALDEAWTLQETEGDNAGGWKWQDFHLAPWESSESAYQGAALLMLEVQNAPDGYANEPQVQPYLQRLQQYLQKHYAAQPLMNQLYILWASSKLPALLGAAEQKALLDTVQSQQRPDGGWSLSALDPKSLRENDSVKRIKAEITETTRPEPSDGYATALVVLALEESGTGTRNRTLARGIDWIKQHQGSDGSWETKSLNEDRDPKSDIGRFMRDAATAYSVMALEDSHARSAAN